MTPERRRQIEQLYVAAINLNEEERSALLAQAGPDVRQRVEAMLRQSFVAESSSPESLAKRIGADMDKWRALVAESGGSAKP